MIGEIVGIGIDDSVITSDGKVDTASFKPVARLGYKDYAIINDVFELGRPDDPAAIDQTFADRDIDIAFQLSAGQPDRINQSLAIKP